MQKGENNTGPKKTPVYSIYKYFAYYYTKSNICFPFIICTDFDIELFHLLFFAIILYIYDN